MRVMLFILILLHADVFPMNDCVKIWIFNCGQGNCVVMKHNDKAAIIDAGTLKASRYDTNIDKISGVLRDATINAIIVTHPDKDHLSYLLKEKGFLDRLSMDQPFLILGGNESDYSEYLHKLIRNAKTQDDRVRYTEVDEDVGDYSTALRSILNCAIGMQNCPDDEGFFPLLPFAPVGKDNNSKSLVLSFSYSCINPSKERILNTILFTGDATADTLKGILEVENNLPSLKRTNIAIIPHHGSETAKEWLNFLFSYDTKLIACFVCIDSEATKFFHPRSIISCEDPNAELRTDITSHGGETISRKILSDSSGEMPHMMTYYEVAYGEKKKISRLTSHPMYAVGDTALGYYQIICDQDSLYMRINPGSYSSTMGSSFIGCTKNYVEVTDGSFDPSDISIGDVVMRPCPCEIEIPSYEVVRDFRSAYEFLLPDLQLLERYKQDRTKVIAPQLFKKKFLNYLKEDGI